MDYYISSDCKATYKQWIRNNPYYKNGEGKEMKLKILVVLMFFALLFVCTSEITFGAEVKPVFGTIVYDDGYTKIPLSTTVKIQDLENPTCNVEVISRGGWYETELPTCMENKSNLEFYVGEEVILDQISGNERPNMIHQSFAWNDIPNTGITQNFIITSGYTIRGYTAPEVTMMAVFVGSNPGCVNYYSLVSSIDGSYNFYMPGCVENFETVTFLVFDASEAEVVTESTSDFLSNLERDWLE